jgi:signal recognition particle receptor subunit beta
MIVNYSTKTIQIKIVYYGCAMSGKTTSLKQLLDRFNSSMNVSSIETTTGRTLFFDFGTLQLKGADWSVKIHLYSATGQDFYASTRPATLLGADGIIFVVDSQKDLLKDNIQSWNELKYYFSDNIFKIPILICLNKQDLPNLVSVNEIQENLNLVNFQKIDIIKTIAINGQGITESFKKMLEFIFPSITIKGR